MKINLMRFIDYRVGRPVCTLLSAWSWVKGLIVKEDHARLSEPESVLFIKLFGIGSVILSYPAIKAFKDTYPSAKIYFLTFSSNREIIELLGMVEPENIITIRDGSIFHIVIDAIKALRLVRRRRIACTVDFEFFSRFTAIFSFLSGAMRRVGFYNYHTEGLSRGSIVNVPVSYNHTKHTSEVFMHLTEALGTIRGPIELPFVEVSDYVLPEGPGLYKKLIVLNVNSSELIDLRTWPLEKISKLSDLILDRFDDAAIIFTGTEKESSTVARAIAGISSEAKVDRVFDLSGSTTVREFIGLISNADAVITIDSGTAHISALTDTVIIDLFGPETPALYAPLSEMANNVYLDLPCQPCVSVFNGKLSHCTDNICLKEITPEAVMKLMEDALTKETPELGTTSN